MYNSLIDALSESAKGISKDCKPGFKQVEGWNEYCKQYHSEAREAFLLWKTYNNPKTGPILSY